MLSWIEDDLEKQYTRKLKIRFFLTTFSLHILATLIFSWIVHGFMYRNPFKITETLTLYYIDGTIIFALYMIVLIYTLVLTLIYALFIDITVRFRKEESLYIEEPEKTESNNDKKGVDSSIV